MTKENKTNVTEIPVSEFLETISEKRKLEAIEIIDYMKSITNMEPKMWGPSIIGFGTMHYKYESGREGDMPKMAFSPRKSAITFYFSEGFEMYGDELRSLGKFKTSVSCLYVNKLPDVDMEILNAMLKKSWKIYSGEKIKIETVEDYINNVPENAKEKFLELREYVKSIIPNHDEVLSYGIIGYKVDKKRARVFISAFKDHLGIYPLPKDEKILKEIAPYIKGKGTLHLSVDGELPRELIKRVVEALL